MNVCRFNSNLYNRRFNMCTIQICCQKPDPMCIRADASISGGLNCVFLKI